MMVDDASFQTHPAFADLSRYIDFYKRLSRAVFSWVTMGTRAFGNIDSYVYSSIQGTLSSIRDILKQGRINDAYALVRKYHDSTVINVYSILYLDSEFSIEHMVVEQIDKWLRGKDKLPPFRVMTQYILSSCKTRAITDILASDDRYIRLRERCNDHTHFNYYDYVLLNDSEIRIRGRAAALDSLLIDVRDVFTFHMAYVFLLRPNYMMSSDYIDCLEVGMSPEPDSQYWVAPFVQEIVDGVLAPHRPDVLQCLRQHTCMRIA